MKLATAKRPSSAHRMLSTFAPCDLTQLGWSLHQPCHPVQQIIEILGVAAADHLTDVHGERDPASLLRLDGKALPQIERAGPDVATGIEHHPPRYCRRFRCRSQ